MEVDGAQDCNINTGATSTNTEFGSSSTTPLADYSEMESDLSSKWRSSDNAEESCAFIDDRFVIDRPFNINERIVTILDQLDTRVEKLRKDALELQEKRDFLFMSIDLIKHNEMLNSMEECDREEVICYIKRVKSRLYTIDLNVKTVRDRDQEESLCQVNTMIDSLITSSDPVMARHKCQTFLNACSGSDFNPFEDSSGSSSQGASSCLDPLMHDKKFENALLGCTLDDQKNIKKRLLALMTYLNQQTISG